MTHETPEEKVARIEQRQEDSCGDIQEIKLDLKNHITAIYTKIDELDTKIDSKFDKILWFFITTLLTGLLTLFGVILTLVFRK